MGIEALDLARQQVLDEFRHRHPALGRQLRHGLEYPGRAPDPQLAPCGPRALPRPGSTPRSRLPPRASCGEQPSPAKAPIVSFARPPALLTRSLKPGCTRMLNCSVRPVFLRRLPGGGRSSVWWVSSRAGGSPTCARPAGAAVSSPVLPSFPLLRGHEARRSCLARAPARPSSRARSSAAAMLPTSSIASRERAAGPSVTAWPIFWRSAKAFLLAQLALEGLVARPA